MRNIVTGLIRVVAGIAVLLTAAVLVGAPPAAAHTELVSSKPGEGSELKEVPRRISLTFSDRMSQEFSAVTLQIAGADPARLKTQTDGATVAAGIPVDLVDQMASSPGNSVGTTPVSQEWTIAYRVVSADGHPVTGTLRFRAPVATEQAEPTPPARATPAPPTSERVNDPTAEAAEPATSGANPESQEAAVGPGIPWWAAAVALAAVLALGAGIVTAMARRSRSGPVD